METAKEGSDGQLASVEEVMDVLKSCLDFVAERFKTEPSLTVPLFFGDFSNPSHVNIPGNKGMREVCGSLNIVKIPILVWF
jgi:hypothetical protein